MMLRVALAAAAVALLTFGAAKAGERDQLNACKAMLAQTQAGTAQDEPALAKCRQIIKEWTLRDSRRSVDEDGRPLR
jgi:hypothetical protein